MEKCGSPAASVGEGRRGAGERRVERGGRGAEATAAQWITPPRASLGNAGTIYNKACQV